MRTRFALLLLAPLAAWCGDWDAAAAAKYLDGRAAEWAVWPRAAKEGGACVSCHTTLGYLIARPELRRALGESAATEFEKGLVAGVKVRAAKAPPPATADNTPIVLNALVLAMNDASGHHLNSETEAAFKALWATQREDSTWGWTHADLEPWEVLESDYFGVALAALATGVAPDGYQKRADIQPNITSMKAYLHDKWEGQPLGNRLVLVWAGSRLEGLVTTSERRTVIDDAWSKQSADGGWTLASLGPWRERPKAPPAATGSNAYATAWAASMLRMSGVRADEPHLARALAWLRSHQDPGGYWDAVSMNHPYPAGSMMERFMRDASTAYAVLALSEPQP
jgi:squalene-hopene/tetraprenyl-beta-curcumene cyclase